ncbi:MAG: ribosome biogenesis GTPase Der, partial [Gemmataceae bacterium]|nr:ribosome biogenesis GTPase Der [Gemmataceae bacterium]
GEYIRDLFPMLDHVPIAFITAKEGKNVLRVLQLAVQLHKQAGVRVSTGDLNRAVRAAIEASPPPMAGSRQPKVFYATQIGVHPPTIVLFTNGPELFDAPYVRYLTKTLRDAFPFPEVALKVVLRAKGAGARRPDDERPAESEEGGGDDETPILRSRPEVEDGPPDESESPQPPTRPRKKSRTSETWDF